MDTSVEMIIFTLSVIWFMMVTLVFVFVIKVSKEKDEVDEFRKQVENSEKKLSDLKSKSSFK